MIWKLNEILVFYIGIVFSTTVALHNSAQAEPQFIFSDDVAQGVRKNISIGVQAGEDFFKTRLGITFSKSFSVVASNTDSFRKRNVPANSMTQTAMVDTQTLGFS